MSNSMWIDKTNLSFKPLPLSSKWIKTKINLLWESKNGSLGISLSWQEKLPITKPMFVWCIWFKTEKISTKICLFKLKKSFTTEKSLKEFSNWTTSQWDRNWVKLTQNNFTNWLVKWLVKSTSRKESKLIWATEWTQLPPTSPVWWAKM